METFSQKILNLEYLDFADFIHSELHEELTVFLNQASEVQNYTFYESKGSVSHLVSLVY